MNETHSNHPADRRQTSPEVSRQLTVSLDACIKEGVAAQIMIGIFDYYLIPLAIFLHASTPQIGFLVSVPNLVAALCQLWAVRIVRRTGNRKGLIVKGMGTQAVLLLPLPLLTILDVPHRIVWLLVFVTAFRVLGSIIGPAWGSMVSDYLPENRRGEYFGRRAQIVGVSGILGMSFWGIFLSFMSKVSEAWGLFVVFLSAAVCRFLALFYMSKMVELPTLSRNGEHFTFWMFVRRLRESNFVRFVLNVAALTFATQLAAAYFSVYMLNDLKFNYLIYMSVHMASLLMGLVSFPIWGRHADIVGNAKILKLTGALVPLVPLFWIVWQHPLYLIVVEMISGFVWGGYNLCATNFIYDAVQPSKRVTCLSYFNLINGVALFAGASLGGYLAYRLPSLGNGRSPLLTLFLLSAICRLLAYFLLSPSFKEVRTSYQKIRSTQLFISVLGLRSIIGPNLEWGIFPLMRKVFLRRN